MLVQPVLSTSRLHLLIGYESYFVAPFVSISKFATFCKDRDLQLRGEQLARFERLGLLSPVARFKRIPYRVKVQRVNGGIQSLGILHENEEWGGETIEETSGISFSFGDFKAALEEGHLWDPLDFPFQEPQEKIDTFYSIFQCFPLFSLLTHLSTVAPSLDQILDMSEDDLRGWVDRTKKAASSWLPGIKDRAKKEEQIAYLCQVISTRYYPHTQTDQRTITVSSVRSEWDWYQYRSNWNRQKVADDLGVNAVQVGEWANLVNREAASLDPLIGWEDLLAFIPPKKKQKLKGKPLLAQTFWTMYGMLSMFYRDLSGQELPDSGLRPRWKRPLDNNLLKELDFVANSYHVNPRPKLILVVEGDGEQEQITRLIEVMFGLDPATAGIEIVNLRGIAQFTGDRRIERDGALKRFIDDYHSRQTLVYVLLDNEHGAARIKEKLLSSQSAYFPQRKVTKDEYIQIWKQNFEFDNFHDSEIAEAMTRLAAGVMFSHEEVAAARKNFGKRDELSSLYLSKTGHGLAKRQLAQKLNDDLITRSENGRLPSDRPILDTIRRVMHLAATNHQPASPDAWSENQKSGFFG